MIQGKETRKGVGSVFIRSKGQQQGQEIERERYIDIYRLEEGER